MLYRRCVTNRHCHFATNHYYTSCDSMMWCCHDTSLMTMTSCYRDMSSTTMYLYLMSHSDGSCSTSHLSPYHD